jgi:hypothetical protein
MERTTTYFRRSQWEKLRLLSKATRVPMAHYIRQAVDLVLHKYGGNMTQDRNLVDVIDQILPLIPDSEPDLKAALEGHKRSAAFSAPERMRFWWGEVGEELEEALGFPITEEWKRQVFKIFTTRDPDEPTDG